MKQLIIILFAVFALGCEEQLQETAKLVDENPSKMTLHGSYKMTEDSLCGHEEFPSDTITFGSGGEDYGSEWDGWDEENLIGVYLNNFEDGTNMIIYLYTGLNFSGWPLQAGADQALFTGDKIEFEPDCIFERL